MTSTSITSVGKGCEKIMCVYLSIDKSGLSRSLERLFNTSSNTKHIKHRQFNCNNYYHFVNKIHSNKPLFLWHWVMCCNRDERVKPDARIADNAYKNRDNYMKFACARYYIWRQNTPSKHRINTASNSLRCDIYPHYTIWTIDSVYWLPLSVAYMADSIRTVMRWASFVPRWQTKSTLNRWKAFIVLLLLLVAAQHSENVLFSSARTPYSVHWLFVSSFIVHTWPTFQCSGAVRFSLSFSLPFCVQTLEMNTKLWHTYHSLGPCIDLRKILPFQLTRGPATATPNRMCSRLNTLRK